MSGKHSNSRRFLSLLLSLSMIAQTCVAGFAAEPETVPAVTEVQTETATAPETTAPETQASETQASETAAPGTQVPETAAPETQVPETAAPETQVPETAAPESEVTVPETAAPEPEIAQQEETAAQTESEVRRNKVTFEYAEGQAIVFVKNTDLLSTGKAAEAEDGKILFTVKAAEGYEVTSVKVDRTSDARKSGNPDDPDEYIIEGILTDSTVVTVEARLKETEAPAEIETETEKQPEEAETETETAAPGTEDSFPAITATRTAANGVTVNISAEEGAFPAGTTLVVRSASRYEAMAAAQDVIEEGKKVVDAVAVDISFVKDDVEIQPTDPSLVHVSLSLADALEGTEHEVVHVEDSGETSVVADASATGAQFQSEGFSVYAIIGTEDGKNEEIARATYNFVLDDDTPYYFIDTTGKTTNSQILVAGDKLTAPTDPTKDGAAFAGWLLDGTAFDIKGFTQGTITADETHTVKASFTDKVYATFYDTDGTTALAKLEPDADGNVTYSGIEAVPDQPHRKFVGWASAPNSTVAEHEGASGTITGVTQDISLYPVFAPAYTITYSIPHGAQYLAPDIFFADEKTVAPVIYQEGSADLRTGYTFVGWYTDEALTTPYSWGGNLTSDITLYSKWEASAATYTIQFWKESLDGGYDFAGKIVENANTGDTAVIADEYKSYGNTKAGVSDFTGFAYDADKTDAEYVDLKYKTVSGDGSTVLNVYYKRNTITIRFHYGTLTKSGWYYTFDEERVGTYFGKYEQPLDNWPEGSFTELNKYGDGYYTKGSGISFLTSYKLPDNKATEIDYYQEEEGTGSDVFFYLEQADGSYTLAKDYETDAEAFYITDKYAGYQAHHYSTKRHNRNNWRQQQNVGNPDSEGSYADITLAEEGFLGRVTRYDLAIYFNLKTSTVHFVDTLNSEQDITTQSVKYTAKITDPGTSAVTHDGYTFKGWFEDAGCTVPFDFNNETMPANDLKIYAGWDAKKYSVHLDANGGTLPEGQSDRFWITFDRKIDPQNPYWTEDGQPDGTAVALFTGWTLKATGASYTTGKRPTDADVSGEYDWGGNVGTIPEIELTANWKMVGSYAVTIVYTDADGNTQEIAGASYADGAIAKAPLSVPYTPDGKALTGWTITKTGANLSLGQEFKVDAASMGEKNEDGNYVIKITPVYGENGPLDVTSVTFNGNGGTVVGENVVGLAMNGTFTMADATREGYTLLGWSTDANATEAQFTAGKDYAANDVNGNTLYAVWARDVYVTITGNTDSKVYNGADQSVTGHTDEFKDKDGNAIDASNFTVTVADNADTAAGKDAGTYYMTMSGSDSHEATEEGASAGKVTVTSSVPAYVIKSVTVKDGSLTITPIAVELTANSATKEYDGTALTDSGYEITNGAFVSGEGLETVTVVGSQTLAGSSENKITAHTLKEGTKAENYTITYVDGTLTVTNEDKIKITITADSDEKMYDGSALTKDSYTLTSGELKSGDTITSVTVTGSRTDAGTSANVPSAARIMHGSDDVTDYYEISYVNGTLRVKPVEIELTADSASKEYDGTPLTKNSYQITSGEFVGDDGLASVTVEGSQTLVGSSANTITAYTLKEGTKAENYTITYKPGTLEVTNNNPIEITITADNAEKTYDGSALTKDTWKLTSGSLKEGDQITSVTVTGSQTDAGSSDNVPSAAKIMHGDTDVTSYYKITYVNGTLTVNPVAIELTADSASKEYDGTPLTKNSYQITSGEFVGDDGLASVTVEGSQTLVGSSENKITAHTLKEGTKAGNYNITYKPGTLEVTNKNPIEITITADSAEKTYDASALTKDTWKLTSGSLKSGDTITSVTVTGSQTDAGSSDNVPSAAKIMHGDTDVTGYYKITYVNGTLKVNPVAIELTADSDSKEYDGTPLTKNSYKITSGAFVGEDGLASVTVEGSQTLVGSSENKITAHTLKEGTKKDNYTITYVDGKLTVTNENKIKITITADSDEKTYDSTAQTKNSYALTAGELKSGDKITSVTVAGSQTDAGTSANKASDAKIMHGDADVTSYYEITYADGKLTVNPVAIELTADSDSKEYDGTPLTKNSYKITSGAFIGNDGLASVTVEGSQTLVGSSENKITAHTLKEGTKAGNYNITYKPGTLEVTNKNPIEITITADSAEKTYDASALTKDTWKLTSGSLKSGDTITSVTVTGSQTDAGSSDNVPSAAKIMHGDTDVTGYYKITYVNGTLKVNPVAIELTAASDSKEYDGTPLTKNSYEITSGAFIGNDGLASVTVEGSQTLVGSSENKITAHTLKEGTKKDNYTITYVDGKLTVTNENKIKITITADSDEKTYDSTAQTKNSYALTAGELKSGDKITSVTVAGSQTDAGTSANKASDAKIMHGDADVTSYYEITYADGKLTVNPVAIELTADSGTKVYDGTPLAKDSYQITSGKFVGEDGLASVMVEGSQTLVGSSDNTITAHTLKEGTKAENYSITYKPGTLTVTDGTPDEPVDPGKVVTKTHEGNKFKLGETITWTIKVKNIYDEVKTITLTELDGVELKQSVFKDVAAGAEITTTATHVVTEADILNGKFHNDVKVEFSGEDKPFHGEDEPTTEDPKPHITVTKKVTSTPAIGESYVEGETIRYSVTAKNDGNLTLTEVVVTDALTGDSWTIDGSFAPGAEKTFETSYVVTAADAAAGTVKNVATATGKGPDGHDPEVVPGEVEEPTHPKYELAIEANSEKAAYDGKEHTAAGLKETKFTVEGKDYTVAAVTEDPVQTNAGTYTNNIDKASIVVKDADGKDVTALFQVATTDGSLIIGKRKITVTADSDEKKYDGTPLTDPDYSVTEGSLADGDTLTAKTEGSQTLVGSSANRIQEGSVRIFTQRTNAAKKAGLRLFAAAPAGGELTEVTDNYEITTKDGTLTVTDGTADDPVDPTKVVTKSHEGNEFKLGETITWTIKVKNIYDEAKTITLTELDGVELEQSVFENVAAGAEITAVATHVVTEADILSGKFHNDVKAEFSGEDKPFHGEDDPTTEKKNPHITITKTVTNSPKSGDAFVEAETIEYSVAVENDGNVTISNAVVTDELTGDSWTIETLAPGQTNSFEAVYEVTAEDVKAGKVTNVATATGKDPSGDEPEVVPGKAETKTKAKAEPAKPETETPKDGPVAPKTGDNNPLMLYLLLLLGSGAIIGGAQLRRRKREDGAQ